ncbi:hypothetical protein DesfrDRAFT_2188 [Solidesulfovibrio fructosivorans JJ]]|uniref:Uncharacterized protein n=1 Tax=Solidesulfovibrio fructosivorans JJ] TaxID=596151 RepID=E1JX64_SOLFR|nr:hypothetical protein [Solidesulfovibrio fructosivorans]EFL51029.1 hypothetical protein DesfrDRAFT_2188 [Solidesulfovibrio fructosivorans JJ]]
MRSRFSFLLALVLACAAPVRAAEDAPRAVLSLDAPAGKILPRHFRTCAFPLRPEEGAAPSQVGLDGLRISGSAEFSPGELGVLAANLPGPVTVAFWRRFYDYARANPGARPLLWRAWLAGRGKS